MAMVYFWFFICLVFCRFMAGYDSRVDKGKYITIRHHGLRVLLLDKDSFGEKGRRRPKKDLNKMTVRGLVFYVYALVTLLVSVLLNLFVPKTPVEPWIIDTNKFYLHVDTLNKIASAACIMLFFCSLVVYMAIMLMRYVKTLQAKWQKIVLYITIFIMLAGAVVLGLDTIKELIMCFA